MNFIQMVIVCIIFLIGFTTLSYGANDYGQYLPQCVPHKGKGWMAMGIGFIALSVALVFIFLSKHI